jgi:proteasome lid subunit RPN8/RPN11
MQLLHQQLAQLIAHARRDAPHEACGVIAGKDGRALAIFPLTNVAREPRTQYNADPHELLSAFQAMDTHNWEHLAIYHSHPATEAYPSATDVARAFYPDTIYILISLVNPAQPNVRAFRIVEQKISEQVLEVSDEPS